MSVNVNYKSKICRQVTTDLCPVIAGIIRAQHIPVFLHKQYVWTRRVLGDVMDAVAHFSIWIRNVLRVQSFINWFPGCTAVVAAECASRGDSDKNAFAIEDDRVQAHPTRAWLPLRTSAVAAKPRKFSPRLTAIG